MPEVHFTIRWPDENVTTHYSPSTIVHNYFQSDDSLTVEELVDKSVKALEHASNRVRERYGYACTRASESCDTILALSQKYDTQDKVTVSFSVHDNKLPKDNMHDGL
jgi:uncharacterized repeat protein (TIGR04042 family)